MTKKEIIKKHTYSVSFDKDPGNGQMVTVDTDGAMDDYAKEIAIMFAKFIDDKYMTVGFDKYIKSVGDDVDTTFTTEQLYSQYINSLT